MASADAGLVPGSSDPVAADGGAAHTPPAGSSAQLGSSGLPSGEKGCDEAHCAAVVYAVVLLHVPLHAPFVTALLAQSSLSVVADGAANNVAAAIDSGTLDPFVPTAVAGDFDSVTPAVLERFRKAGAAVVRDTDQDHNDLDKCLRWLQSHSAALGHRIRVVVYGGFGGRVDHVLANMSALYHWAGVFDDLVVCSEDSCCRLLGKGAHTLSVTAEFEGPHCGLVPLGCPVASITTSGLKWNLDGHRLEFRGLISTSNLLIADTVTVETTDPVLYCVELQHAAYATHCSSTQLSRSQTSLTATEK